MLPCVVLVRPQMGENIGAVARAMNNFGLRELRIVAPRDGWPNAKANEMAANATDIIEHAKIYDDVPNALADIHYAAASTARPRDLPKDVITPNIMAQMLHQHSQSETKTAIVFGPERTGLTNEDLALCDVIVTIPTAPENASLNIAQAAVVLGYAWWTAQEQTAVAAPHTPVDKGAMEHWFKTLEAALDAENFWNTPEKKERMWYNLRALFMRAQPSAQEVQTLHGMLKSLRQKH